MIEHAYFVQCSNCFKTVYIHNCQNKTELQKELEARGYFISYQFKTILCEDCNDKA